MFILNVIIALKVYRKTYHKMSVKKTFKSIQVQSKNSSANNFDSHAKAFVSSDVTDKADFVTMSSNNDITFSSFDITNRTIVQQSVAMASKDGGIANSNANNSFDYSNYQKVVVWFYTLEKYSLDHPSIH